MRAVGVMRVDVLMTAVVVSMMLVADVMAAVVNVMMTAVVVDVMMAVVVDVMMTAAAVDVLMTAVVVSMMLVADVMATVVDVMAAVVNVMMAAVVVDVIMAAAVDVMMMAAVVDGMMAAVDLSLVVFVADVDVAHATGLSLPFGFCATGRYKVLGYLCCTCRTGIGDKFVPPPQLHGHESHGHTAGSVVAFWQRERFEHSSPARVLGAE